MSGARLRLSIVVPVLDEADCLPELARRLACLDGVCERELILVDDGSSDGSWRAIERLADADPRVRGLGLAHHAGGQRALLVGVAAARGDAVVTLDADLQHPPEAIAAMIAAWRSGAAVVEMERENAASQGALRDLATPLFYALFNRVSSLSLPPTSTDFRLLDRAAAAALVAAPDRGDLVRTRVRRLARPTVTLRFCAAPRFAGGSRYGAARLLRTALGALCAAVVERRAAPPVAVARTVGVGLATEAA